VGAVDDLIERMKRVDMSAVINKAVMRSEGQILNLNRKSQLSNRGIKSDGDEIHPLDRNYPYYHPWTIENKKQKGQITKFVTLRDTGAWQNKFKIEYRKNEIELTANSDNRNGRDLTLHLQNRYGSEIFGLTEQNITRLQQIILPDIIQQLRNE
jgi:hypothetical protein